MISPPTGCWKSSCQPSPRKRRRHLAWVMYVALALNIAIVSTLPADDTDGTTRVMSFNIRYGTAQDGENHWDRRKDFVVDTIRAFAPDLLGTQETIAFQRDYIAERLPDHDWLAVGRTDGREEGEMMAIFYRKQRYEKLDGGHFWLSETPEVVGSVGWDSALPRMVTWVRLRDRQARADESPIVFLNTHFDHRGVTARHESARLIRREVGEFARDARVVLTGDFNAPEGSAPYTALFAEDERSPSPVVDTYRRYRGVPHEHDEIPQGTSSGFKPRATSNSRIDWIAVSPQWSVVSAAIDRTERDGRTPSDHFPVTAILKMGPAER